jgi:hypothetical protein
MAEDVMGLVPFSEFAEDPSELDEFISLVSGYMHALLILVIGCNSSVVHHQPPTRRTPLAYSTMFSNTCSKI